MTGDGDKNGILLSDEVRRTKFKKVLRWVPKHNNIKKILKSAFKWEKTLNL